MRVFWVDHIELLSFIHRVCKSFCCCVLTRRGEKTCYNTHFHYERRPLIPHTHQRGTVLYFQDTKSQLSVTIHNQIHFACVLLIWFSLLLWFGGNVISWWSHFTEVNHDRAEEENKLQQQIWISIFPWYTDYYQSGCILPCNPIFRIIVM